MTVNMNVLEAFKMLLQESNYDSTSLDLRMVDGIPTHRDAFGRFRVSQATSIFESKNLYTNDTLLWEESNNLSGASTYLPNESSISLSVPTTNGAYAIRQTYRYFNYVPGKSHLIVMTGNFQGAVTNVTKRIGYFDTNNGLFFEVTGGGIGVVKRSKVTGSIVDTRIEQVDWNVDSLDGGGPSGIVLDISKAQIESVVVMAQTMSMLMAAEEGK